uniref:Transposase Tc1-like domain-containing protein n=1 Tax=Erpetoichthys calabaricus TaxID=27687 RepID=A0A8C4T0H8_ERPCA
MGKKGDLSDFERDMVVGARQAGLSVSETADLLRFSHTTISRVYREWSEKGKISSEWQRMARLVGADRKATLTQATIRYNQYIRRPHQVPLLSAKNRQLRLQFALTHQILPIEYWKNHLWDVVECEICIMVV